MNTIPPLLTLGMMLTVIFMGLVSVILFWFIPNHMGVHQKRIVKQFMLYSGLAAMAFVTFILLPSWVPRSVTVTCNSLFYIAAVYLLRQGLLVRKDQGATQLIYSPIFCINMLWVAIFQYGMFTQFPNLLPFRVSILNLNIILIFVCCLPLVSGRRNGERVVRYAIFFSIFLVLCMNMTLFFEETINLYPLFVMAIQALLFLVWLGSLFGLLLADSIREHYHNSMTDVMTGVNNRRYFFNKSNKVIKALMPTANQADDVSHHSVSLIICDIDNFKRINDKHGHAAGDIVIKHFAEMLQHQMQADDILARIGGEEFAILLPDTTLVAAKARAEKLRQLTDSDHRDDIHYTASFGVSSSQVIDGLTAEGVLLQADKAMYYAKSLGRNTVCTYDDIPPSLAVS